MARIIVYGDIHGCLDELTRLRDKINVKKDDVEIAIGDMINKGPQSKEVLKYIIREKIHAIIGNNEEKLIRYHYHKTKKENSSNPIQLNDDQKSVYQSLDKMHFEYLQKLPYYMRFGDLTLIHGGITSRIRLNKMTRREKEQIIRMRWIDKNYRYLPQDSKAKKAYFWSEAYDGHEGYIVYGHQVFERPRFDKHALGIDTGCVYGNRLTCAMFQEKKGRADTKKAEIEYFEAKKTYEKR